MSIRRIRPSGAWRSAVTDPRHLGHFAAEPVLLPQSSEWCKKVEAMSALPTVLLIDDDPSHLEIYASMVQQAGFSSVPVLVRFSGPEPMPDSGIDLVLLDYRLNSVKTAPEIAQDVRTKFPDAPIILLTDLWSPPADIQPFITSFVRKGEPAKLFEALRSRLAPK